MHLVTREAAETPRGHSAQTLHPTHPEGAVDAACPGSGPHPLVPVSGFPTAWLPFLGHKTVDSECEGG